MARARSNSGCGAKSNDHATHLTHAAMFGSVGTASRVNFLWDGAEDCQVIGFPFGTARDFGWMATWPAVRGAATGRWYADGDGDKKFEPLGPPLPKGWDPRGLPRGPDPVDPIVPKGDGAEELKPCPEPAGESEACGNACDALGQDAFYSPGLPPNCVPDCDCQEREVWGPTTPGPTKPGPPIL